MRRRIVETGHVDVMISIRSNFFYTRTVPCEFWFFDKGKPGAMQDKNLLAKEAQRREMGVVEHLAGREIELDGDRRGSRHAGAG